MNKPSAAPTVLSVITLVISLLAFICSISLILISVFGPDSGGSSTAITNRALFFVSGMVLFTGAAWILAMIGILAGFIMLIVNIAVKRAGILWMPITSVVVCVISMIMSIFAF